MRHPYALVILLLAILVAAGGLCTPAVAQTALRPHARLQAPAASQAPSPSEPAPTPAPTLVAGRLTLQGLPRRFDAAPACRASCTVTRVSCEAVDDACGPQWNACLQRCAAT